MDSSSTEVTESGGRYVIMRGEHTKVEQRLHGRLMSSFSIARVKTFYGACEDGVGGLLSPNCC